MRNLNNKILYKKPIKNKLLNYGFKIHNKEFIYKKVIFDNMFKVEITYNKNFIAKIIDNTTLEEYVLVDIDEARGDFAGKVKQEYESIIEDIINNCFEKDVYKTKQAKMIINYLKEKYQCELEFLWDDENAIARNKDNNKWFILFMVISKNKLGDYDSSRVEVINLKYPTDRIDKLVDNKKIFKGYHMNKKHWITIVLDNKLNDDKLLKLVDTSYILSND